MMFATSQYALTMVGALDHPLRLRIVELLANTDFRVQELATRTDSPMNLLSYHLRKLRQAGLVREHQSIADGRDLYYSLDLSNLRTQFLALGTTLHPTLRLEPGCLPGIELPLDSTPQVLFLCTHNSARSLIAEAILRQRSEAMIEAFSAGTHPTEPHPLTLAVLASRDIPIRGLHSKHYAQLSGLNPDLVVTVCDRAREQGPGLADDGQLLHWSLPDPVEVEGSRRVRRKAFEAVAQELELRIDALLLSNPFHSKRGQ